MVQGSALIHITLNTTVSLVNKHYVPRLDPARPKEREVRKALRDSYKYLNMATLVQKLYCDQSWWPCNVTVSEEEIIQAHPLLLEKGIEMDSSSQDYTDSD